MSEEKPKEFTTKWGKMRERADKAWNEGREREAYDLWAESWSLLPQQKRPPIERRDRA